MTGGAPGDQAVFVEAELAQQTDVLGTDRANPRRALCAVWDSGGATDPIIVAVCGP